MSSTQLSSMDLPAPLAWLVDEASASTGPDRFLAELGSRLLADGLPLAGGTLALAVPHPIIARRTFLWRAETGAVIKALAFAGAAPIKAGSGWLTGLGPSHEEAVGTDSVLGWASSRDTEFARFSASDQRHGGPFVAPAPTSPESQSRAGGFRPVPCLR